MTIKEIFETMDYGPAPESAVEALAWLVDPVSYTHLRAHET